MRQAGRIVARILNELSGQMEPGLSTLEIDRLAEVLIQKYGVKSAFKGYKGFKHCICTSINDEVVHGIPTQKRILKTGDIIGLDFGVIHEGYYGDAAITLPVGDVPEETKKLLSVTEEALKKGISKMRVSNHLFDISHAIQQCVESHGFSVVREFVGHGIGQKLHEDPAVPNYGEAHCGVQLKEGMVFAVEPMVNQGGAAVKILNDGWTAVTVDRSLSAHFEHTIAILSHGPDILTTVGEMNA